MRRGWGGREVGATDDERAIGAILLMEMFCMLLVSMSISQFGYGTTVFFKTLFF